MDIRVFKIIEKTSAEGPGTRFCMWVQGCSRHCKGCYATNTWDKSKGTLYSVEELFEKIKSQQNIEGVTFLGGEPFEQAEALAELAEKIQLTGLSLVTFTGNTYENLLKINDSHINKLLRNTDLLIDGDYQEDKQDYSRPWVGSYNQRYLFLSDRYSMSDVLKHKNKVEIRINKKGNVFMNGMGDMNKLLSELLLVKNK